VTFSNLNITLGRELVFVELSARGPGHLSREDILGVSSSGRYGLTEICLLPGTEWFREDEFDDVVSCQG
jgi:hypothetical protein